MTSDFTIPAAATALAGLTSANVNAADAALLQLINDYKNGVKGFDILKFYKNTATLASDTLALAVANMTRYVVVDTEGAAATDNLSTISGGSDGQVLYLIAANAGRVITLKHNVGNIKLWGGVDVALAADKVTKLFYNGTNWSDVYIPAGAALVINTSRTVLGSNLTSISISSIPATYKHLLLVVEARTDVAAAVDSILLRFNGDTGSNYDYQFMNGSATTVIAAESLAAAYILLPFAAIGNTGPAGNGLASVFIYNYASATMMRGCHIEAGSRTGTTTGLLKDARGKGWWRNTAAAINTINLYPLIGTNIVTNSAYTLYGFK